MHHKLASREARFIHSFIHSIILDVSSLRLIARVFVLLRRLKLHGQNHTKCTQFGPCKKIVFHRLSFLKTEY